MGKYSHFLTVNFIYYFYFITFGLIKVQFYGFCLFSQEWPNRLLSWEQFFFFLFPCPHKSKGIKKVLVSHFPLVKLYVHKHGWCFDTVIYVCLLVLWNSCFQTTNKVPWNDSNLIIMSFFLTQQLVNLEWSTRFQLHPLPIILHALQSLEYERDRWTYIWALASIYLILCKYILSIFHISGTLLSTRNITLRNI